MILLEAQKHFLGEPYCPGAGSGFVGAEPADLSWLSLGKGKTTDGEASTAQLA